MNKIILISTLFISTYCTAQTIHVPKQNKTFLMMYTESTSNDAGTYGWDGFREIIDSNVSAVCVNWYGHGDAKLVIDPVPINAALVNNFVPTVSTVPSFLINTTNIGYQNFPGIRSFINSNTSGPVNVNTGFMQKLNSTGDTLTVTTKTEFFETISGEIFVAVYLYEDTVTAPQTGQGNNAKHIHVWRTPNGIPGAFGKQLTGTSFTKGDTVTDSFKIYMDPKWDETRIKAFTVTWQKSGGFYSVANANDNKTPNVSVSELPPRNATSVYPNPAAGGFNLNLSGYSGHVRVTLSDITGREITELYNGIVNNAIQGLQRPPNITEGLYLLHVSNGNTNEIIKLYFK